MCQRPAREKVRDWWERSTPFDLPDVPEDQRITAVREAHSCAVKAMGVLRGLEDRRTFQSLESGRLGELGHVERP